MAAVTPTAHLPNEDELDDMSRRALAIYEEKLKALLEPEHDGKTVAIHLDTSDHALERNSPLARAALRARHPHGAIVTLNVGLDAGSLFASRLMLASRQAK